MRMIEISESKKEKMSELTENILKYGGKLMSCLEEMDEEHGERYGKRESMGGRYGQRMKYRHDDDEMDDDDEMTGERRMRSGRTGRYM